MRRINLGDLGMCAGGHEDLAGRRDRPVVQAYEVTAATLQLRILEYARTHLHEPDPSVEQIAAANSISVRYLY